LVFVVLVVAVTLLAASCGEGESDAEPAAPETSVEVTLWPGGRDAGGMHRVVLTCGPAGGTHPHSEEACAVLASEEDALEPVPADVACTQIYGGPQEARVAGVVGGREIDASLSRTNGCEIDRWDRLAPLLDVLPTA
jgi:Subtilisin inhibitor-like